MAVVVLIDGFLMLLAGLVLQGPLMSLGYNLETSPAATFSSSTSKQFGYQVLQIGEGPEARIIVGAPGEQNSTGKVYQCEMQSEKCENIPFEGSLGMPHFGMTLAGDIQRSKMIVCGPGKAQHCDKNLYVSGICYLIDTKRHETRNITTGYQKCLKGNVDLVFLFDGSQSMSTDNFNTIKEFMIKVMEELHNSTIHFAAVQFSKNVTVAFQFNDYIRDPNPRKLLAKVEHEALVTNTFKAIKYVAQNVFTSENGMREGANKVMIIITDGEATDDYNNIDGKSIRAAKEKGILRLVIGVGHHFNSTESQQKLQTIASEPTQEFVKVLAGFEELKDSFNDLQSKIYAIEGTSDSGSFHLELSSSGFSADISRDRIVLGAVGADNWAGGLLEQQKGLIGEKFITIPSHRKEMDGAYLGYSLAFLQHQKKEFYAVGAPRYQHVGRVLIFGVRSSPGNWTLTQEIEGKQIGSYFGGVLCSVDLDNNNKTDLLLIGAPQHFEDMKGGRVYVYSWTQASLVLLGELKGDRGYSLGRFGAAITDLADINGDGLADVAVGAPLEDENRGAVYIYHGLKKTLQMQYSQRIKGASVSPNLMFFGQSIHGKTDLSKDGLPDILVGALGKALVLRSRPIVIVKTTMEHQPAEIPVEKVQCSGDATSWQKETVSFSICFYISLATKSYQGFVSADLSFQMEIDPKRMKNRGEFLNGSKILSGIKEISLDASCLQQTIHIMNCIEDYISPISIFINFSLEEGSEPNKTKAGPVLSHLSSNTTVEIPFEKNCGEDEVCEANLQISFHDSSSKELLVIPTNNVDLRLELENHKEDAYYVSLHIPYIPGLSFRRGVAVTPGVLVSCDGLLEGQDPRELTCNISHPIYKAGKKAVIDLKYGIIEDSSWEDNLVLEAYVKSNNEANETLHDNTAMLSIPVRYPVSFIITELETNKYVNFSSHHQENKTVTHAYKINYTDTHRFEAPAVTVFVMVPVTFPAGLTWKVDNIQTDPPVTCQSIQVGNTKKSQFKWDKQCSLGQYDTYQCALGQISSSVIRISGMMSTKSKPEHFPQSTFCTGVWLTFDTRRYKDPYNTEIAQFMVGYVEMLVEVNYLPVIIGSGLGGFFLLILIIVALYKCGFFNRNYKKKMGDQEGKVDALQLESSQENESENGVKSEDKAEGDKGFTELLNGETEIQ